MALSSPWCSSCHRVRFPPPPLSTAPLAARNLHPSTMVGLSELLRGVDEEPQRGGTSRAARKVEEPSRHGRRVALQDQLEAEEAQCARARRWQERARGRAARSVRDVEATRFAVRRRAQPERARASAIGESESAAGFRESRMLSHLRYACMLLAPRCTHQSSSSGNSTP
jgi:hypothetical protein